jgi:hypothetical protein
MAEKDMPSFAVDADITPLQGRYFQNVQSRISDPRLRAQAYGLIKQTFGGIQQARDIQRTRQQEEEDRALNMDVRRAQLEQGKLELSLAREKFRRQQELAATGANVYAELDRFAKDPKLTPDEKAKGIYGVAARNPDLFTDNPVVKNRLEYSLGEAGLGKGKAPTATTRANEAVRLISSGASVQALIEAGIDPNSQIVKDLFKQREEEKIAKMGTLAKDAIKPYEMAIDVLKTGDSKIDWPEVDEGLRALDELNLVDEQTKKELEEVGVGTFNPEASKYKAKSSEEAAAARKKTWSIIQKTVRKAGKPGAAPRAPAPSGFDPGGI